MMGMTQGINHLGLTVVDIATTAAFFVDVLGWTESGDDPHYPKTAVTDGVCRLTLWQAGSEAAHHPFDRRRNIGLHHLALQVESDAVLADLAGRIADCPAADVEFMPEPMGQGPRKHMMFVLNGGPRIELTWPGPS